jgi:hypothetical protein
VLHWPAPLKNEAAPSDDAEPRAANRRSDEMKMMTGWIHCVSLSALALACSADPDVSDLDPRASGSESVTDEAELAGADLDEAIAPLDVEALKVAPVTSEEMLVVSEYITSRSLSEPTSIEGRIVRWDDAWMTVDDLLDRAAAPTLVEKGYANTVAANPAAGNNIEFFRPDIGLLYRIVIQDNVPNYVFTAVQDVINEWVSADVDCLGLGGFTAIRQSAFNALTATQRAQAYEIVFNFVPITTPGWPCGSVPNGPKACAQFPGNQPISINGVSTSRLAVGDVMHFDSGTFPSNNVPKLKRILRHEFGHTFGFDHQLVTNNILIPGTQSCGQCLSEFTSVMTSPGNDTFTADDKKMLRTLYANVNTRANDDCQYIDGFRLLSGL